MALTAVCFFVLSLYGLKVSAQGVPVRQPVGAQPGAAPNVALLDVSYIFKKHPRFKSMMEEMKTDVERAESDVNREKNTLRDLVGKLESFRKGSDDYKAMEEEIAKREADLTVRVQLQRKDFLQREAKIYHSIYQEIAQEVDYYCKSNGIDMVLRFNGDPVDVDKPDSVLSFINKPVVWYDPNRDITPIILENLIKRGGTQVQGTRMGNPPSKNPFQK
jgi:Skp family chaperone for outer membrane proteins